MILRRSTPLSWLGVLWLVRNRRSDTRAALVDNISLAMAMAILAAGFLSEFLRHSADFSTP